MNAASTIICHRLADPDPVVTRAGTVRRAERSHQLGHAGPTGAGSLRIQDAYRVDPNDVRSLPAGVAFVVSGGRAANVVVARGGQALPVGPSQRELENSEVVGPGYPALHPTETRGFGGDPALGRASGDEAESAGLTVAQEDLPVVAGGSGQRRCELT
jgi:hypothetical protein